MIEEYRAGLGPDRQADKDDRAAGRQISCPTMMLWSATTWSSCTATR
jgi:haloacetate dehalogenase